MGRVLPHGAAICLALVACERNRLVAYRAGVLLADCTSEAPVPTGTDVALTRTTPSPLPVPQGVTQLRLAIARDVPWQRVRAELAALKAHGVTATPLCAHYGDTAAFTVDDPPEAAPYIRMTTETKGKFCIQDPALTQAYCVHSALGHISGADVRLTMRETVTKWERDHVHISFMPEVPWGDAVRAIDATRTCCGSKPIHVTTTDIDVAQPPSSTTP